MQINGKVVQAPSEEVVVIPRGEENIVFKAKAVLDFEAFEKLNPMPEPPEILYPGGVKSLNVEDEGYQKKIDEWAQSKTDWMILKSLEATEGLTWDTVDKSDPQTWGNYRSELASVFTPGEVAKIIEAVMLACGLIQERIDEATKRFLAGPQE